MKYCSNCGQEVNENQAVCLNCGVRVANTPAVNDTGGIGWGLLGFFVPMIGLILFLMWKETQPKNGKAAFKGAIIGFVANIVLAIIYMIFMFSVMDIY